ESPVEWDRFLVRTLRTTRLLVRRFSPHPRVERVIAQSEPVLDVILPVRIRPDTVPDIGAAAADHSAGVVGEPRLQAIEREWARATADLHLDGGELTALVGVIRWLSEQLGQLGDVLRTRLLRNGDA